MIDKINEISSAGAAEGIKGKKGSWLDFENDSPASQEDGLAVSSFAREMVKIADELNKIPEVREAKVEEIKNRIENGTYSPDLDALAKRLVWAGITKSER